MTSEGTPVHAGIPSEEPPPMTSTCQGMYPLPAWWVWR